MRVLQINTVCGHGSTGVIAVEIAELLEQNGHECYIAYGHGKTTHPKSYKIGSRFESLLHSLIFTRILGLQGLGSLWATKRLTRWIDKINPDLIQLHTLHCNFINLPILFNYLRRKGIPIVWSLFDCYSFTGKCTHFTVSGCRRWESGCHDCPQLHSSGAKTYLFDQTRRLYALKKQLFSGLKNLNIITCSNWLKSEVERSFFKDFPIHMIYNWIDCEKFKPIHNPSVYHTYGIDPNKKYIIGVSAVWDTQQSRYQDAMRLAAILPEEYQLVLVGKLVGQAERRANTIFIPYVNGIRELSKLYSSAIAFAGFSVEDTFGKVIAEAMLCGTPAIVFNSTACPEVVGEAGFIVPPHDIEAMLQAVKRIDQEGKERFSQQAIEYVKANYDYKANVKKYLELYLKIINK